MFESLPPLVTRFVDASNARDLESFVACFAADAVVEDEGRTHRGLDAVRGWKQETEDRYRYTIEPTGIEDRDGRTILLATLAGNFPGSPVDLSYEMTIADGAIAALNIHP
jgi:hypothetical protein